MTTCTNLPMSRNMIAVAALSSLLLLGVYYTLSTTNDSYYKRNGVSNIFERNESEVRIEGLEYALRQQRALIETLSCKVNQIGARGGFCLEKGKIDVGGNSWWDFYLARNLETMVFQDQVVGDLGAGLGWYGRFWMRNNKYFLLDGRSIEEQWYFNDTQVMKHIETPKQIMSWEGYDGAGNVDEVTNSWVYYLDLTEEHNLPVKYDWVFSLEVGEHIPHIHEDVFINNLIRHACKGVVLSWAVEGQGGHFHVNNHNNDYIKQIFSEKGFINDQEIENRLRSQVKLGYLKDTLMVFNRTSPLQHHKCLRNTKT